MSRNYFFRQMRNKQPKPNARKEKTNYMKEKLVQKELLV